MGSGNDSILDMYLYETNTLLEQLDGILLAAEEADTFSEDSVNEIFRIMHTIKGSSAMMEFSSLMTVAHRIEDLFFLVREKGMEVVPEQTRPDLFDMLFQAVDFFRGEIEKVENDEPLSQSIDHIVNKINSLIDKIQGNPGAPSEDSAPAAAGAADTPGTDMDIPDEAADVPYSHKAHRAMDAADITQKEAPEHAARAIGERFADTVQLDRSREQWENAALEMGIQLDAYAKLWGIEGSNLAMNLRKVTREKHDYRAFLRKFSRMGEQIRVNDDEFDYVFYTYGLQLYGNLPLVEPVEFAEEKRIRDFVIAIDTSASTKDGLVRRFIERTYSILADETSFFSKMNVLVIQCDAAVTDVARITCLRDLEDYLENPVIKGLGGTDFRPVFAYVDGALAAGELNDLGGLIYFTDGQGTYPARRPAFETAFVFLDSDDAAASAPVPPWAMKVVLDETFVLEEEPL